MSDTIEDVESFRARARRWLAENVEDLRAGGLPSFGEGGDGQSRAARVKEIQAAVHAGGLAGPTFPVEYGGLGLTVAHLNALNEEIRAHGSEAVNLFNLTGGTWGLSIGMIAPTMLEFGTEEQKRTHIAGMLKGELLWAQMLSEPTGGSDLAGAITRADRDGDIYLLNGSKVWTSQADFSDMAVCLARTNWDVPKHAGLSMFIVDLKAPGMEIIPLRLSSGGTGFCQEFMTDMAVPTENVLGEPGDGWNVATRLLVHERNTVGGGSGFHTMFVGRGSMGGGRRGAGLGPVALLGQLAGDADSDLVQAAMGDHVTTVVNAHLSSRIVEGMGTGALPPAAGSMMRLFGSMSGVESSDTTMTMAGSNAVAWPSDMSTPGAGVGLGYLGRQGGSMASGTAEIQKNIISERVLGLPREPATDRDTPFKDVRTNTMPTGS
jgi:alkylation response protein AidB-like acyl-CoA dehydrogenase